MCDYDVHQDGDRDHIVTHADCRKSSKFFGCIGMAPATETSDLNHEWSFGAVVSQTQCVFA